jgi:hypothetical protein
MKRCSLLLSLCSLVALSAAGCGTEEPDAQAPADPSGVTSPAPDTAEAPGTGTSADVDGDVQQQGKVCYASCTVQRVDPAVTCPSTISGYGNTTFLGGCNKACDKARGDASSKLPAGCVINQCSHSGC